MKIQQHVFVHPSLYYNLMVEELCRLTFLVYV